MGVPFAVIRGAKAACSVHGSALRCCAESILMDFHELRRRFISLPPNPVGSKPSTVTRNL
jgi:hypothetical protein